MRLALLLLLSFSPALLQAGEFNTVLSPGDAAPAWKELPGVDGKAHSLADLPEKKLVAVVFTCNSCPIAVDYEDRILAFAAKHAESVAVVAINVNTIEEDRLEAMKAHAEEKGFTFPYLFDETQQIAKDFGATGTPEFCLLSPERKVIYMGALDDNTDPAAVKTRYLEDAVAAALAGRAPEKAETFANGCRIRYERRRRE